MEMELENRETGKRNEKWKITDRPTDRPADRPTGRPTDRPTDRLTGRPTGRPADRPADRLADRPTDRPGLITENHTPYSELKMGNGNCSETESEKIRNRKIRNRKQKHESPRPLWPAPYSWPASLTYLIVSGAAGREPPARPRSRPAPLPLPPASKTTKTEKMTKMEK